jgi:hypothetical protein
MVLLAVVDSPTLSFTFSIAALLFLIFITQYAGADNSVFRFQTAVLRFRTGLGYGFLLVGAFVLVLLAGRRLTSPDADVIFLSRFFKYMQLIVALPLEVCQLLPLHFLD